MPAPRTRSAHRRRGRDCRRAWTATATIARVPAWTPSAGPEHEGVEARVLQDGVQPLRTVAAPQHDRGELRRVDPEGLGRRGHGHEAGADPQRRPRRQPRRAGPGRAARGDQGMAALIFVRREPRPRQSAAARDPGALANRCRALGRQNLRPMPISATSTSPQCARPGMSRWPGFRAAKVTVRAALTAMPRTAPVSPSMPEGRSTASIGWPDPFIRSTTCRAAPSRSRARPAPKSASTMRSASAKMPSSAAATGPAQPRAASAASPVRRPGFREGTGTRDGPARPGSQPRRSRRRRSARVRRQSRSALPGRD